MESKILLDTHKTCNTNLLIAGRKRDEIEMVRKRLEGVLLN